MIYTIPENKTNPKRIKNEVKANKFSGEREIIIKYITSDGGGDHKQRSETTERCARTCTYTHRGAHADINYNNIILLENNYTNAIDSINRKKITKHNIVSRCFWLASGIIYYYLCLYPGIIYRADTGDTCACIPQQWRRGCDLDVNVEKSIISNVMLISCDVPCRDERFQSTTVAVPTIYFNITAFRQHKSPGEPGVRVSTYDKHRIIHDVYNIIKS